MWQVEGEGASHQLEDGVGRRKKCEARDRGQGGKLTDFLSAACILSSASVYLSSRSLELEESNKSTKQVSHRSTWMRQRVEEPKDREPTSASSLHHRAENIRMLISGLSKYEEGLRLFRPALLNLCRFLRVELNKPEARQSLREWRGPGAGQENVNLTEKCRKVATRAEATKVEWGRGRERSRKRLGARERESRGAAVQNSEGSRKEEGFSREEGSRKG